MKLNIFFVYKIYNKLIFILFLKLINNKIKSKLILIDKKNQNVIEKKKKKNK